MKDFIRLHGQKTWSLAVSGLSVWGLTLTEAQTGWLLACGVVVVAMLQRFVRPGPSGLQPPLTVLLVAGTLSACTSFGDWKDPNKARCIMAYSECATTHTFCLLQKKDIDHQAMCLAQNVACIQQVQAQCPVDDGPPTVGQAKQALEASEAK